MKAIEYPKLLASAIAVLKRQGVISYPTEGVWGLGCDPMSEVAVRKVLRLKNRSISKGLILICLLYTSPSPRDTVTSRMPSSA